MLQCEHNRNGFAITNVDMFILECLMLALFVARVIAGWRGEVDVG